MQIRPDPTLPQRQIQLEYLTLPIQGYQLKNEVPVLRRTLADGSHQITLLEEYPCTLTVQGKILHPDMHSILSFLKNALHQHTAFQFAFADMTFTDMQILSFTCDVREDSEVMAFAITFSGGMQL
ncbi:MAG: hypothetical protein MJ071_05075 [Oscillospiraceae bacterium]|nr:hypothetical protein [Oscillospiraceae bacterium]